MCKIFYQSPIWNFFFLFSFYKPKMVQLMFWLSKFNFTFRPLSPRLHEPFGSPMSWRVYKCPTLCSSRHPRSFVYILVATTIIRAIIRSESQKPIQFDFGGNFSASKNDHQSEHCSWISPRCTSTLCAWRCETYER